MNHPRRRLDEILARCEEARELAARGHEAFANDALLRHTAKSIISDIGEAAKNLEELAGEIPEVPWTQIARMRDRVTYRYFDVDYDVVWDTITNDLPTLEPAVRSYLDDDNADS